MRRLFVWGTLFAGAGAAYLMYKRGAPLGEIARNAIRNPVEAFVNEVKNAV